MSTYNPIASVTLSSLQTFVTFNNIPQTYTDLVLVINGFLGNNDGSVPRFRLNNDSGNNYSLTALTGTGSTAKSSRYINQTSLYIGSNDIGWSTTSGNRSTNMLNIMNYSSSNTFKATLCNTSQPAGSYPGYELEVGTWRNTAPVTSLTVYAGTAGGAIDFASTTTFNLYGIANASIDNVAKATGGDSVYTDGTYWYHIFRSSGTFTPTQVLTADYLVVAGGAGGGFQTTNDGGSGGGGAGGLRSTVTATGGGGSLESALSLTAQSYTVTVGAGGSGSTANAVKGTQGNNSVFATVTSTGGGGGGSSSSYTGNSGGSGGGGAKTNLGGAGTSNQGYAGGRGLVTDAAGGGGGGAGAIGNNSGGDNSGGAGGAGIAVSITGSSVTYAGGGGGGGWYVSGNAGGAGGSGGGGTGGAGGGNSGSAGTANTGGGGGGAGGSQSSTANGGNGGSGIVIVRYSV